MMAETIATSGAGSVTEADLGRSGTARQLALCIFTLGARAISEGLERYETLRRP